METTSRQQHIYDYFIDADGKWFCEGNPVVDPQLFALLSRSLFQKNGCYFIHCEGETHPVRVADVPLRIRYVHVHLEPGGEEPSHVEIELQDGRREPLSAETLTVSGNDALYCLATRRRLKARFGKVAYYELTRFLRMEEESERFYFIIAGRRYDVRPEPPAS